MEKEINCLNFRGLLEYLRKHYGDEGVRTVTEGLTGNPAFLISDRKNPSHQIPVTLEHLQDSSYWVSNEFSLRLLANVKQVIRSPSPLFTAGEGATLENFSKTIFFLARLLGPRRISRRVSKLNTLFNKTKTVHLVELTSHSAMFRLTYFPNFRVTKDVCEWNRGIYSGIARLAGAIEVQTQETTCQVDGDPHCDIAVTWKRVGWVKQIYRWLLKAGVEDLVADYEKVLKDREQLIDDLSESKQRYRSLTDYSLTGIFIYQRGRLVYVNEMLARFSGYTSREIMEKPIADLIHGDYLEAINDLVRLIQNGSCTTARQEFQGRRKDGSTLWLEVLVSTISFQGAPALMGNVIDITERKQAEEAHRSLEERLQRAEKMEALGTLAGGVAHDLNNVLGVLVGFSELLQLDAPEGSPLRDHALNIFQAGQRATAIIQDLLTLARRGVEVSETLNLNQIVTDFLKTPEFDRLKSHHPKVTFQMELASDLFNIKGSPTHLGKTVMNLLSNGAEAVYDLGEVIIRTENRYIDQPIPGYEETREGEYVLLMVSDTGSGIPQVDLRRIFEPFYTKKVMGRSGTGLGLAVVWGTVKDHNGYIDVQSEEGKGSTFYLYFPVTREILTEELKSPPRSDYLGHGESILVVDDVKEQRSLAATMLGSLGYQVNTVASGEEAVEYLKNQPEDLLVLDMIMDPGIDGLETYERILEIRPGQRAIIVSGFSETDRVRKAQALGAGAYVRKPYVLEKIGLAVRRELDKVSLGPIIE
jgi:PAS domain S-box-containing protein